jgi:hypothetical protein
VIGTDASRPHLAFPGAQGFGAEAVGGRGGRVVKVVNLDPDGEGSLRWALEELSGPRIVVFEVGGVVDLDHQIQVGGDVTVAGQTAPGEGITVRGARLVVVGDDVIIRGLRIRPGDGPGQDPSARDAISIGSKDAPVRRVIIDHNSLTWATDENAATWYQVSDVTFSNNIIAEGLSASRHAKGDHSMGLLVGDHAQRVSVIGNLFAHNRHRNPTAKAATEIEILNNLVYNWGPNALEIPSGAGAPMTAHAIGNVFIPGPDTVERPPIRLGDAGAGFAYFLADNLGLTRPIPDMPEAAIASGDGLASVRELPIFAGSEAIPAGDVEAHVLATAGARLPALDSTDARILSTVQERGGRIISSQDEVGGYHAPAVGSRRADCDEDGIPDVIEARMGADPTVFDAHEDPDGDGYSNIETYINGLIDDPDAYLVPDTGAPLRPSQHVEFEDLAAVEGLDPRPSQHASAGSVLQAKSGSAQQRARWKFDGPEGLYSLRVGYFDEEDGVSRLTVLVDGAVADSWTWDAELGDGRANRKSLTSHQIRRVTLVPGSCIVLAGEAATGEPLRLDALDVVPELGGMCIAGDVSDLLRRPVPAAERGC